MLAKNDNVPQSKPLKLIKINAACKFFRAKKNQKTKRVLIEKHF